MEILPILLLAVLEISHSDNLIVVNDPHVSIRHARKKEQASREDHVLKIIDNQDELSAFTWSTESPMVEELTTDKTIEDDETLFYDSKNVLEENFNYSVKEDVVTKFLRIVESQNELGENCTAGTDLNLGEGVVDRYAQERFRVEAEVAVNRANMLTRLWKYMDHEVMMKSEYLLHANVLSMVEFNENIFAGGNCYDEYQYKPYLLFCPYAYRLPEGGILVKNLAVEYKYLGNNSEWFFQARKNAEKVINKKKTYRYEVQPTCINTIRWHEENIFVTMILFALVISWIIISGIRVGRSPPTILAEDHRDRSQTAQSPNSCIEVEEEIKEEGSSLSTGEPQSRHVKLWRQANDYFAVHKLDEALMCYNGAIAENDGILMYYKDRGICHLSMNSFNDALRDFEKAMVDEPENLKCVFFLVRVALENAKYDTAIGILELGLKFVEENESSKDAKHLILFLLEASCKKELEKYEYDGRLQRILGQTLFNLSKYREAVQHLFVAFQFAVLENVSVEERTEILNLLSEARLMCRPSIEMPIIPHLVFPIDPKKSTSPEEHLNMEGNIAYLNERYEDAVYYFTRAIEINDTIPKYFRNRGRCKLKLRLVRSALEDFTKVLFMEPSVNATNLFLMGYTLFGVRDYNMAIAFMEAGYHTYTLNATSHTERIPDKVLSVRYEDGRWSKPYYDCGGGNIWMLTYTVPFFGYDKAAGDYFFKGTSGIDIDLRRVDIDQCPTPKGEKKLNIFAASDKCKKETTYCVPIEGFGFRRGSYKCVCRKGFYFSNHTANHPYFDGAVIEEEYEKLMLNERSIYNKSNTFQCLPCAEGCENCTNSKPCILALNWVLRSVILGLSFLIMFILIIVGTLTWRYQDIKVVRAASPALLRVIAVGAFFIYLTTVVMYPSPTIVTCTAKIWFREIGFSLTYGALMLKTWRISRIFHIKSARKVRITDMDLLKKLGLIVLIFISFLSIRTLVDPPLVLTVRTADDLQAYLCESNMWDHWFTMMEVVFLMWGIRLCIMVRKAPSEFNESRWISLAIYNEFILSIFLNVSMFFVHSPANPDLLYVICFGHTQMTVTVLLCFIFGSKAYMIHTGNGKDNNNSTGRLGPKMQILSKKTLPTSSQAFPSTTSIEVTDVKMTEEDVREEIHHTCQQLELLKERSAQLGSEKLATRLKAAHEYVTRTMGDLSTDEQRSSAERSTDDPYPLNRSTVQRVPNTANNCKKTRHDNCAVLSIEADRSKNACSTNSAKSSGSCGLKKYIFRKTNFFSSNHGNNSDLGSGAVDVPMEPLQVHDVFTVEEKSKDSQVSL